MNGNGGEQFIGRAVTVVHDFTGKGPRFIGHSGYICAFDPYQYNSYCVEFPNRLERYWFREDELDFHLKKEAPDSLFIAGIKKFDNAIK